VNGAVEGEVGEEDEGGRSCSMGGITKSMVRLKKEKVEGGRMYLSLLKMTKIVLV
jgi:hypothetical protein